MRNFIPIFCLCMCVGCNNPFPMGGNRTSKSDKTKTQTESLDTTRKDKIIIHTEKPATEKDPIRITIRDKNQDITKEVQCPADSTVTFDADDKLSKRTKLNEESSEGVMEIFNKAKMKWLFVAGFFGVVAGIILLRYSPAIGVGLIMGSIVGTAAMHFIDTYDYIAGPAIIVLIVGFLIYLVYTKRAHYLVDKAVTTMVKRISSGKAKEELDGESSEEREITKKVVRGVKKKEGLFWKKDSGPL